VTCRVKEGLSRSEQLVVYFYIVPPLGAAYCLPKPGLALIQRQSEDFATSIWSANTLTLLIKASAMLTVYRGRRQTLIFLPRINFMFIMCIGIIRINYFIGGRTWAEA